MGAARVVETRGAEKKSLGAAVEPARQQEWGGGTTDERPGV